MASQKIKTFRFKAALLDTGWLHNACISVDNTGKILKISSNENAGGTLDIDGYALPGFQNAHSHAFQYAMAGIAEHRKQNTNDDFWGWREAMYQLALSVSPEQLEEIATMLYIEMLKQGYTNVAEFHYLHHDVKGKPYSNVAEMGTRIIAAAERAGINLTLIPIFYQKGGFAIEANERQGRFISTNQDEYLRLLEASTIECKSYDFANIGMGVHSLRAVEPEVVKRLTNNHLGSIPFHIHVSEQKKEVEDSITYLGRRPVEWLLENIDLDERYNLVHATHLSKKEVLRLAKCGASVVLCPSTEGNLGDGIFSLKDFQDAGGQWSIGTDSHIGLNPLEELRILDYGQRLNSHYRHTYTTDDQLDSGHFAISMATKAGRKAMNNYSEEFFKIGAKLNACVIDSTTPLIASTSESYLTSTIIYSNEASVLATIVNGRVVVENGFHSENELAKKKFAETITALRNR